jgi:hypothetical protein
MPPSDGQPSGLELQNAGAGGRGGRENSPRGRKFPMLTTPAHLTTVGEVRNYEKRREGWGPEGLARGIEIFMKFMCTYSMYTVQYCTIFTVIYIMFVTIQ